MSMNFNTHISAMTRFAGVVLIAGMFLAACAPARETVVITDRPTPPTPAEVPVPAAPPPATVETDLHGEFDFGKMWMFENPPMDYFAEAYDFRPDSAWFTQARLGALRFSTYCSASFVSPNGLVMTNNHCGRESVESVSESGENLLETGFNAEGLDGERRVEDLHVDQLIEMRDVTPRILSGIDRVQDVNRRAQILEQRIEEMEARLTSEAQARDSSLVVEIISLYHGGRYSAYTFRRFDDVRLVFATEHRIGYFGGDFDNFTYPRYNLDYAFFRAYNRQGDPVRSFPYYRWSTTGAEEGDVVFVIGNPGSTSRMHTIAQLEYERDFDLPQQIDVIESRVAIFERFIEEHPEVAEEEKLRSTYFSLTNQLKAQRGQLAGLHDPYIMARRRSAEQELAQRIAEEDTLRRAYGNVIADIRDLQQTRRATTRHASAYTAFGSVLDSQVLTRGLYGYIHSLMRQRGFPQESMDEMLETAIETPFYPEQLEIDLLEARLRDLQQLASSEPAIGRLLANGDLRAMAERIIRASELTDSLRTVELFEEGFLRSGDAAVELIEAIAPMYFNLAQQMSTLAAREDMLTTRLAQARFAVYGDAIPPDASFSLRIADGVVSGYPYNGTRAPAYTTFFGMYDRYHSHAGREDWELPQRWLDAEDNLDLRVPVNLVSTNDITGGNSGSPLVNRDLEIVGLIFDSNIDALPNEYIYLDDRARAVSVDARAIIESLNSVYGASSLVNEILTGRLDD
jgi:hypothetical protein